MAIAADCKSAPSGFGGSSPPPPTFFDDSLKEFGGVLVQAERNIKFTCISEAQPRNPIFSNKKAEVAQLVEHQPSKLRVASSNLVFRSTDILKPV